MLVLSRRADEKILLPTVPAVIKVISSQAGLVRLGIEAPSDVPILREELTINDPTPRTGLRNRLANLEQALTLLRMQLADAGPAVCQTLDDIDEELQVLRGEGQAIRRRLAV